MGAKGGSTDGASRRDAGFPGEPLDFEAVPAPGCSDADIRWSGGGDPPTGVGRRFRTTFTAGGVHTVTARCGNDDLAFQVSICPIREWLARARLQFYGQAIDFDRVRVKASRLVLGRSGTGWTCNEVIRFKRPRTAADLPQESTLIHELGHVWEHQTGQAQLLKGIVEQIGKMLRRDPYDFGGPEGVRRANRLPDFTKEGQAEILRSFWMFLHGSPVDIRGVSFATPGYVDDLRRLVQGAGIAPTGGIASTPLHTGSQPTRRALIGAVDSAVARVVNRILG